MSRHHANSGNDSLLIPYHVARGDDLLQDQAFSHDAIMRGLNMMAEKYNVGTLAYSPILRERFKEIYERRYATDDGPDQFQLPNYAPYVDDELANMYGLDTEEQSGGGTIVGDKESFGEAIDRMLDAAARETSEDAPGLSQMMDHYKNEEWARYGVANEVPYAHADPDVTLFRNPGGGWSAFDRPAATSDRANVIDMYQGVPDYTFPTPHSGWSIDREGGYWDNLEDRDEVATGF